MYICYPFIFVMLYSTHFEVDASLGLEGEQVNPNPSNVAKPVVLTSHIYIHIYR